MCQDCLFATRGSIDRSDDPEAGAHLPPGPINRAARTLGGVRALTLSYDGGETYRSRLLAVPSVLDGINVTHDQPAAGNGTITHRAILAVDSMVVDLRISDYAADDAKIVQLAKTIANRNAL